jgi:hypothetical protein
VQRSPARRDLADELGGRRAPVARPEQDAEPPVPVVSTAQSASAASRGRAGPESGGPAGSVTLSSVTGPAVPAVSRQRVPGGSHSAVSRWTGVTGPSSPKASVPAPSITYQSSPPAPGAAW